jgi:nucleobase:cation symporter-1, NCS1 family
MEREEFRETSLGVADAAELARIKNEVSGSSLYNEDLAPTGPEERTWTTYNITALWIGMAIVITTYTLASGLMAAGMNWWQALLTISLGNIIVLIPMLLNAHAGTKYGVPFPVFVRASFGVRGANFAAMARALVACGWFGIQTWIGGLALDALMTAFWGGWANITGHGFIAFLAFWAVQVVIILTGIEGVKWFESYTAPLLIAGSLALLAWGFVAAGGIGAPSLPPPRSCSRATHRSGGFSGRPWRRTWGTGSRCRSTSRTLPVTPRASARRSSGRPSAYRSR